MISGREPFRNPERNQERIIMPARTDFRNLQIAIAICLLPLAQQADAKPAALERTGSLTCLATDADTSGRDIDASKMTCELKLFANNKTAKLEGRFYGKGLYLADPAGRQAVWRVLAPKPDIEPRVLEGDYDVTSSTGLSFPLNHEGVLVGGTDDTIALELLAPDVDAIDPATRLTLEVTED